MSFTPTEIAAEIQKHIPEFTITYEPDFVMPIAPASIDDCSAREDWNWNHEFDLNNDSGYVRTFEINLNINKRRKLFFRRFFIFYFFVFRKILAFKTIVLKKIHQKSSYNYVI
jgi:hypothetical protein